jgi:hydrogenase maturation factor
MSLGQQLLRLLFPPGSPVPISPTEAVDYSVEALERNGFEVATFGAG